jgi:hypothetical protein
MVLDRTGVSAEAAPLDDSGHIADHSKMKVQMQQAYVNAKGFLLNSERHSTTLLKKFYMSPIWIKHLQPPVLCVERHMA